MWLWYLPCNKQVCVFVDLNVSISLLISLMNPAVGINFIGHSVNCATHAKIASFVWQVE